MNPPPVVDATRELEPRSAPIGWEGRTLIGMLEESERLFSESGRYWGLDRLEMMESDPIGYEKLFSRLRGGLVSARETAMNISASPIVRELGELCFALYTPEGDSIALSTGIIVHVHTMSDAIKYMVRSDYERNPRIRPGDIFANNDPVIGDVHNADVQTFVPIFWQDELVAWAGGVTHVLDIGATTPGGVPVGPTNRLEDGIDLPCIKIGEGDELARWHLKRCELQTRAPMYYLLDEKTRLAGCHMVREAVERVILEEGIEQFKQFSREVIEEGRRSFKSRIREMTVPGRYRSPGFMDNTFTDKPRLPPYAQRDFLMHAAFEARITGDGTFELDFDGTSAWGHHSMNCTPSGMQGAIWVQFTQTLICNDKVNDGAYLGLTTNFPEGTISNLGDASGSTGIAWGFLQPAFTGFPRVISRAVQSRGFIEEVIGAYSVSGNVLQGGGIDQYGNSSAITNFEIAAQGLGAKYVLDGTDFGAAMFNPEGDAGDVEMWELISPFLYLSRKVKASSGGCGRHRGGSSFESLFLVWKTPFWEIQNLGNGQVFTSPGIFGGYPGSIGYIHNIRDNNLMALAQAGEAYPVADGDYEHPALMALEGEREYKHDTWTTLAPIASGDLYLSVMKGASGLGDPLLRPPASVVEDVREEHLLARFAGSVYGVVGGSDGEVDDAATSRRREEIRRTRLADAEPVGDWYARERERVLAGEIIGPLKDMYAESMKLSPRWAAEYRGFWDLDEDFQFDGAVTPTVALARAASGRITPEESVSAYLDSCRAAPAGEPVLSTQAPGRSLDRRTLEALLDERLSRREVKDIQSGFKNPDRFDQWVSILQERVAYDEPIVLPAGEGLNIVRSAPGRYTTRCDCGHDFGDWKANWKLEAVVHIRSSLESLREVYPKMGHCDPAWMELREYQCPSCARQLEVESMPPGYPIVHEFLPDLEGFYGGWLGRELP
jgi:N-methylhydantoinase B/oxoprolinase/acetone carboxylase alpha subunit/acetone carboxylase gamma subunit